MKWRKSVAGTMCWKQHDDCGMPTLMGPKQDRERCVKEAVWPTAFTEGASLANLTLVTQSGKLAPVGFGKEAFMSSAGENAECHQFRGEKNLLHQDDSWAITQKGLAVCLGYLCF